MLAVSALRESAIKDDKQKEGEMEMDNNGGFPDFLDSIDFDDLFLGIDVLPDLLPDLSSSDGVEKPSDDDHSSSSNNTNNNNNKLTITTNKEGDNSRRKTTSQGGKRKVKVDWTPELHRRFVQAVEQLGVDKAVPSRILEIMGIDCLTRHNIASHLQKYRSHRKHLLAREAEAATWSQRRPVAPISSTTTTTTTTTMGFPHHHHHHMPPMIHFMRPPPHHHHHPLHVWGHPSTDQHLRLCPPPSTYNSYSWQRMQVPHHNNNNGAAGFGLGLGGLGGLGFPVQSAVSFVPSKESIDAAIGDVLNKPWLPLPLGLKPPSTDSVLCELQRQGVPNVPHSSASA